MAFNPISLITGAVSAGAKLVKEITGFADQISTTAEEKMTLVNNAQEAVHAFNIKLEELSNDAFKGLVSLELAALQSGDKYVRRARPTGLYIAYTVTGLLALVQSALLILAAVQNTDVIWIDSGAIATMLLPLYGNAAWYVYNRTKEKMNGQA